jgi:archaemetzincin
MAACGSGREGELRSVNTLEETMETLRPLHRKLGKPRPADWLAVQHEPGQTFAQYRASSPVLPTGARRVIYVQPLGEFTDGQRRVVTLTAEFLGLYFDLPTRVQADLPLSLAPLGARRRHPAWGMEQVLTGYVLDEVLIPRRPDDAAACIAFTACDLWPGPGWNFVFGQASVRDRVGVWSIYRNGDADGDAESFRLCLLRTMKTGAHETGHMFSMLHCTAYECGMNGSNSREEADRRPLALCPECMAKLCWATGADPLERYGKLAAFCDRNGLKGEAEFYELSARTLAHEEPRTAGQEPRRQE